MQIKDLVDLFTSAGGLLVSLAAFIVSLVVAITTARSGKAEEQRTVRYQLTDTFNQLFATSLQVEQQQQGYESGSYEQLQNRNSLFNQQFLSLLGQATFLANKIKEMVTPVEYNTLAIANASVGEFALANKYAQSAIDRCDKDDLNLKARATASYGMILYMQSNFQDGNARFQEAVAMLSDENSGTKLEKNLAHYLRGSILSNWASSEKQCAAPECTPDKHFDEAEQEFNCIEFPRSKAKALQDLDRARKAIATTPLPDLGQSQQGVQIQQSIFNQLRTPGWFQRS